MHVVNLDKMITMERLKELLYYNPKTGLFTRVKCRARKHKIGDIAGTLIGGYIRITIDKKTYAAHKLAYFYMTGDWPKKNYDVHHKNEIRDDNKWCNLECLSRSDHNRTKKYQSKSGIKCIQIATGGGWRVVVDRESYGHYDTLESAIEAKEKLK